MEETNHLLALLKKFPDQNWNYDHLSKNPNINMKYVKKNPFENWNWNKLSDNMGITMEDINNNPKCKWNPYVIASQIR